MSKTNAIFKSMRLIANFSSDIAFVLDVSMSMWGTSSTVVKDLSKKPAIDGHQIFLKSKTSEKTFEYKDKNLITGIEIFS